MQQSSGRLLEIMGVLGRRVGSILILETVDIEVMQVLVVSPASRNGVREVQLCQCQRS
jgi:hypothetical protein